jgi:two-component system, OmpR family, response regulator CpxR
MLVRVADRPPAPEHSPMPTRILIIDDDVELCGLLREFLSIESYEVDSQHRGGGAAARATGGDYSLIVLDVMLPEVNGLDILRDIRKTSGIPVILLTARGDDVDRILGLELGADDYVPKPFNPRELLARMHAVMRRLQPRSGETANPVLEVAGVVLDPGARTVVRDGRPVPVTTLEFDLLRALMASAGQVVSREALSEQVLERQFDPFDRSIDMHVSKLRRKLEDTDPGVERIKTVRGVGYIYALPSGREAGR